mmetsp:Transcript_32556/g.81590  ORF Transcript_32556/g.81590 Transcript_32556/m.81590 type:complete len:340 (-) Transcript_32556:886-1905(-)|eukprot:CAMPEP_0177640678 /NCGR_PEP_ID=MMETSP0447-20121125/6669_1 /TAXON_ID=0 /ORGANISM="Stygamoeba regulata, Strain BSH-02190019" /LENGTH=339 /DNA_ID=CAMNT_0019142761 /DNA_START=218 /DNA_END=1237 /DNA_ORIENTATION=+
MVSSSSSFLLVLLLFVTLCSSSGLHHVLDPTFPRVLAGSFTDVSDVAVNPLNGEVYLAQRSGSTGSANSSSPLTAPVVVFDAQGNLLRGIGRELLLSPHGIKVDPSGQSLWVTDTQTHTVVHMSLDGFLLREVGTRGVPGGNLQPVQFSEPTDVAFAKDGGFWVSDGNDGHNNRVLRFDSTYELINVLGGVANGSEPGQFYQPHAITTDAMFRLYVSDRKNFRIAIFDDAGGYLGEWNGEKDFGCMGAYPEGLRYCPTRRWFLFDGKVNATTSERLLRVLNYTGSDSDVSDFGACQLLENLEPAPDAHLCSCDPQGNLYVAELHTLPSTCARYLQQPSV